MRACRSVSVSARRQLVMRRSVAALGVTRRNFSILNDLSGGGFGSQGYGFIPSPNRNLPRNTVNSRFDISFDFLTRFWLGSCHCSSAKSLGY
jgi:hypothetical protein